MTNREALILALKGEYPVDDGGAAEESIIAYNISCPYHAGDERCHCEDKDIPDKLLDCAPCKYEWLDMEEGE